LGRKKTKQNISQGENSGLKKRISQKHLYCKKGKKEDHIINRAFHSSKNFTAAQASYSKFTPNENKGTIIDQYEKRKRYYNHHKLNSKRLYSNQSQNISKLVISISSN
jgi:hypothetical protein